MYSVRKKVYAEDLINIITSFKKNIAETKNKLGEDEIINKGLFLMTMSFFEDSIRKILRVILISFPEKLNSKNYNISNEEVCQVADSGHDIIIENELYILFKKGMHEQLKYLFYVVCNFKEKDFNSKINDYINKCADIYLYRNSLIHNGGSPSRDLINKAVFYKIDMTSRINFTKRLLQKFFDDYYDLILFLEEEVKSKFKFYNKMSRIEMLKNLWYKCFDSPILNFEDYWEFDTNNDLIINIKYPKWEGSISSGEKILLSIWRHQYYDAIKTEEFLLCSINYTLIYELYKGLDNLKFYYMYQEAKQLGHQRIRLK